MKNILLTKKVAHTSKKIVAFKIFSCEGKIMTSYHILTLCEDLAAIQKWQTIKKMLATDFCGIRESFSPVELFDEFSFLTS
jgi:hypothetical protein